MTANQIAQLKELRQLLRAAYDNYFEKSEDGYCKSSEGYVEVYYPNYFEADDYENWPIQANGIGVYSYVLGPSRMHHFETFDEALATVRKWHKSEMEHDYSEDGGW